MTNNINISNYCYMNIGLPQKEFGSEFFHTRYELVELIFNNLYGKYTKYHFTPKALRHKYEIYKWLYQHERYTEVSKLRLSWLIKYKIHEAKKDFKG